jgi:protein required for attachment to host cells
MAKIGIMTADGARARFISAEVLADTSVEGSPKMQEHDPLINPLGALPAREVFSDRMSRKPSGAARSGAGPSTDDHRERHEAEDQRRFARQMIEAAERFVSQERPNRFVILASPRLLGTLRAERSSKGWAGLDVLEIPEDHSGKSLPEIQQALTRREILPAPKLPQAGVFRPRGQEPSWR